VVLKIKIKSKIKLGMEVIVTSNDNPQDIQSGIFKFENCSLRNREKIIKNASCCSSSKIEGYYCNGINKFPVQFSTDCQYCTLYQK